MFAWFKGRPDWTPSAFSELPEIPETTSELLRDHCLIVGGLALVLSRCPPRALSGQLRHSHAAYRLLRRCIRSQQAAGFSARLWSEVAHEIAELADGATRAAVRRCLQQASVERSTASAKAPGLARCK